MFSLESRVEPPVPREVVEVVQEEIVPTEPAKVESQPREPRSAEDDDKNKRQTVQNVPSVLTSLPIEPVIKTKLERAVMASLDATSKPQDKKENLF